MKLWFRDSGANSVSRRVEKLNGRPRTTVNPLPASTIFAYQSLDSSILVVKNRPGGGRPRLRVRKRVAWLKTTGRPWLSYSTSDGNFISV